MFFWFFVHHIKQFCIKHCECSEDCGFCFISLRSVEILVLAGS